MDDKPEEYYLNQLFLATEPLSLEKKRRLWKQTVFNLLSDPDPTQAGILLELRRDKDTPPSARDYYAYMLDRISTGLFIDDLLAKKKRRDQHRRAGKAMRKKALGGKPPRRRRRFIQETTRRFLARAGITGEDISEGERCFGEWEERNKKTKAECLRLLPYFTPDT